MMIDTHEDIKLSNAQIAWRAAQDIQDGAYVNLGIGFPEMVARYQPEGREAIFHTENGVLDFGEAPPEGEEDWDLINAGKKAVTLKPGAAFFHHADGARRTSRCCDSRRLSGCPERRSRQLAGRS
jgi:3-oxoadipate CoA-transferase beta subunit